MCFHFQKVDSISAHGVKRAYIPCGECEDCRRSTKLSWSWRLAAEMESLVNRPKPWKVGFITLTYNEEHLPHFPKEAFRTVPPVPVPCFSRKHATDLILAMRKHFWNKYGISKDERLSYMLAGEFGSVNKRPHYHAIFIYPPCISSEEMHKFISDWWTGKHNTESRLNKPPVYTENLGYVIPEKPQGDEEHNPFEVNAGNASKCAIYASKYLCKDLNFYKAIKRYDFDETTPEFKNGKCFHLTSRSLGLRFLSSLNDSQRLELIRKGYGFFGLSKLYMPPLYIKNKLIFDNVYILKKDRDGHTFKRIVQKKASAFFLKHSHEIYEKKVGFYEELIKKVCSNDFIEHFPKDKACFVDTYRYVCDSYYCGIYSARSLASYYVSYYGVNRNYCFDSPHDSWIARYTPDVNFDNVPIIPRDRYDFIQNFWSALLTLLNNPVNPFTYIGREFEKVKEYHDLRKGNFHVSSSSNVA